MMCTIQSLLSTRSVPLAIVLHVFVLKVEAKMRFGRWLWGCDAEVLALMDQVYNNWARQLLGADVWRNPDVCRGELGWSLSGRARVVLDVATKRYYLWQQTDRTLAAETFIKAHMMASDTWSKNVKEVLDAP